MAIEKLHVCGERFLPSVDWLTATRGKGYDPAGDCHFTTSLNRYLASLSNPADAQRWAFMGFYGWSQAKAAWGSSHDRYIVRAHGEAANMAWFSACKYANRVSCLDLAVTFWPTNRGDDLAAIVAEKVLECRDAGEVRKEKKVALISGFGDGDTLYIGSRKSQTFARLYDKSAQSSAGEFRGAWRAELELKDDRALAVARKLVASEEPYTLIASYVYSFFLKHGVDFQWEGTHAADLPSTYTTRDPSVERLMLWLSRDVKPAVLRAVRAEGRDAVLAVLGVDKKVESQ